MGLFDRLFRNRRKDEEVEGKQVEETVVETEEVTPLRKEKQKKQAQKPLTSPQQQKTHKTKQWKKQKKRILPQLKLS